MVRPTLFHVRLANLLLCGIFVNAKGFVCEMNRLRKTLVSAYTRRAKGYHKMQYAQADNNLQYKFSLTKFGCVNILAGCTAHATEWIAAAEKHASYRLC